MLRRFTSLETPTNKLKGVYTTIILPKLVYSSPVWSSFLNTTQLHQLERVQKIACRVILGPAYVDYTTALTNLSLPTLAERYHLALPVFRAGLLRSQHHRHLHQTCRLQDNDRTTRYTNKLVPLKAPRTDRSGA